MRRTAPIAGLAVALALAAAHAGVAAGTPAYFLVRADPRLCPSPLCGGAWVHRVNHATTRCADGTLRRECYVAAVSGRGPGTGDLVLATIVPAQIDGLPRLGKLVVRRIWLRAAERAPASPVFRVADTGVRCIAAPCFSYRATRLESSRTVMLSDLDLRPLGLPPATAARALRGLTRGGLLVSGVVSVVPRAGPAGDGRVLTAQQAWTPAAG